MSTQWHYFGDNLAEVTWRETSGLHIEKLNGNYMKQIKWIPPIFNMLFTPTGCFVNIPRQNE